MGIGCIGVTLGADHSITTDLRTGPQSATLLSHLFELLLPPVRIRLAEFIGTGKSARYTQQTAH
jgi:hypothetical protein